MCVVSMVGDHYHDKWQREWPQVLPNTNQPVPAFPPVSRMEFDELKRDVQEMKELLIRAKKYDEENGEPECEIEEKMDVLRRVAKLVGVELDGVIGKPQA